MVGLVKDNQLHALAVTSPVRVSEIPDVPTVAESGFEGYELDIWFGVVAPAETPEKVIAQSAGGPRTSASARTDVAALGAFATGICGNKFGCII